MTYFCKIEVKKNSFLFLYFAALFSLFLVLPLFYGCTNLYRGDDVLYADDFVIDSYKIKEGKFSILEMQGSPIFPFDLEFLENYKDTLQENDFLKIALFHPVRTDLVKAVHEIGKTVGYPVREGKIMLPELAPIEVSGLSLNDAQNKIQEAYGKEVEGVEVFLSYARRKERKVQLAGMVGLSSVPVDGKLRLFEVLSQAKIPPQANLFNSYMIREDKIVSVDMHKLLKKGDMSQNIVMRGGDKVYIAESSASTLMVIGEVRRAGIINVPNGFMPLREAIAMVGGVLHTGDMRFIQVIRGNISHPKIYTLNWKHILRLPTMSMLLIPGDVVYVAATPITEWNRFITQLFPTLTGIDLFKEGAKGVIIHE